MQTGGIQKYIFEYHRSAFILPFSFWDLLLFNRWHTWWGTRAIANDINWTAFWPITTLLTATSVVFWLGKKIPFNKGEIVLTAWVICYSAMLSLGYTSTRYFLPLVPFLYILATSFVVKLIKRFKVLG